MVIELRLGGLLCMENCGACVQAALEKIQGVESVEISSDLRLARIEAGPNVQVPLMIA